MEETDLNIKMNELQKRAVELLEDDDWICWKKMKDGSKILKKSVEKKPTIYSYNGCIQNADLVKLTHLLNPYSPLRSQWDSQLKDICVVEEVNDEMLKVRHRTIPHFMGLVSERELLDLCKFSGDEMSRSVLMTDTTHPSDIPTPGVVRARTLISYLLLNQNGDKENPSVNVTAIVQGETALFAIPRFIQENIIPTGIMKFISDLRKACETKFSYDTNVQMPVKWRMLTQ